MHGFKLEEFSSYRIYLTSLFDDNSEKINKLKTVLKSALQDELTERQILAIKLYYIDNLSQKDIAKKLQIDKSGVSRHIKKGKLTLQKFLKYNIYITPTLTN